MSEDFVFSPSCEMVGKTIYCQIETDIANAEFAFYVILDGERKATFWYTDRANIEYACGDEIINEFEIVFFIRTNGSEVISKSITKKSNWSLDDGVIEAVKQLATKDSVILEFGSGIGSKTLSEICTIYSVEHDERFLNRHESVNYIHAPLVDIEPIPEFGETKWYDSKVIEQNLPAKIDFILLDGPPEEYGRSGILKYLHLFGEHCIWIIDDVLRLKDQKIANYVALKWGYVQYKFWNFSIIASSKHKITHLEKISEVSYSQYLEKSNLYVSRYYPSI